MQRVLKEVINPVKLKAGAVLEKVNLKSQISDFSHYDHMCLCSIFSIRPYKAEKEKDPFNTNSDYCHYDEPHKDYLYQEAWVDFIVDLMNNQGSTKTTWKAKFNKSEKQEPK